MVLPLATTSQLSDPSVVLILGIVGLVPLINGILNIVRFFRQNPPASDYALRAEVASDLAKIEARFNARIEGEMKSINKELEHLNKQVVAISKTVSNEMASINRALGRLEGITE